MTKHSKKLISFALCMCVFFTLLTSFIVVHAQVNTVYEHNFNEDGLGDWTVFPAHSASVKVAKFETYKDSYLDDNYYLRFSYVKQSWYSPCLNIYNIIKNSGAGTYHVSMKVAMRGICEYQDSLGTHLLIRGESSDDVNSFIKDRNNGNYFATIGSEHGLWPNTVYGMDGVAWTDVTGTFKVQESDLIRDNGVFNLCLSNLPTDDKVILYVEKVKIIKYDNKQITNGDFTNNFDGWCVWTDRAFSTPIHQGSIKYEGDKSLTLGYEQDKSFFYGSFVRTKTYGSVATSVDPILSFYGPGEYTLSMKIKMERLPNTLKNHLTFFFTKEMGKAHFTIGKQTILENTGWRTIILNFTLTEEAYKRLDPDNSRVHFRIQSPTEDIGEYNGSFESRGKLDDKVTIYDIADVKLTAKTVQGSVKDNEIYISKDNGEKIEEETFTDSNNGERGYIFSLLNTDESSVYPINNSGYKVNLKLPNGIHPTFETSNRNAFIADSDGKIQINSPGTASLTINIGRYNYSKTFVISVAKTVDNFTGFAQLQSGNCWAACAKMCAYQYSAQNSVALTSKNRSLASAISACNELYGKANSLWAGERIANYYLNSSESAYTKYDTYNTLNTGMKVRYYNADEGITYNPSTMSANELIDKINNNIPVVCSFRWPDSDSPTGYDGHVAVAMGYYYNNSTLNILFFDPCKGGNYSKGGFRYKSYNSLFSSGLQSHSGEFWSDAYYLISN